MEKDIRIAIQVVIISGVLMVELLLQWLVFHSWEIFLSLSGWLLAFAIAYWFDRNNTVLNSILISSFLAMIVMVSRSFLRGEFYDMIHLYIVITGLYIIFGRSRFRVSYVMISFGVFMSWGWFIFLTGINYEFFTFWFMVALTFIGAVNVLFSYALARYKGYLSTEGEEYYFRLLEDIRRELENIK